MYWEKQYRFIRDDVFLVAKVDRETGKQLLYMKKEEPLTGRILLRDSIQCIHTAVAKISASDLSRFQSDYYGSRRPDKKKYRYYSSERLKDVDLVPKEHFFAMKSWVQGIAEAGIDALYLQSELEGMTHSAAPIIHKLLGFMSMADSEFIMQYLDWIDRTCTFNNQIHEPSYLANLLNVVEIFRKYSPLQAHEIVIRMLDTEVASDLVPKLLDTIQWDTIQQPMSILERIMETDLSTRDKFKILSKVAWKRMPDADGLLLEIIDDSEVMDSLRTHSEWQFLRRRYAIIPRILDMRPSGSVLIKIIMSLDWEMVDAEYVISHVLDTNPPWQIAALLVERLPRVQIDSRPTLALRILKLYPSAPIIEAIARNFARIVSDLESRRGLISAGSDVPVCVDRNDLMEKLIGLHLDEQEMLAFVESFISIADLCSPAIIVTAFKQIAAADPGDDVLLRMVRKLPAIRRIRHFRYTESPDMFFGYEMLHGILAQSPGLEVVDAVFHLLASIDTDDWKGMSRLFTMILKLTPPRSEYIPRFVYILRIHACNHRISQPLTECLRQKMNQLVVISCEKKRVPEEIVS